jgi:hypothetical protein
VLRLRPAVTVRISQLALSALPPAAAAQGLEGTIVACSNTPYLCKIFTQPLGAHEADGLQSLIDFREWAAQGADRETIRTHFSWPVHRVIDDASGVTVGVLIPAAEARFYYEHGGNYHLREGQHLPRSESVAGQFDMRARLSILRDLARAWDLLERHGYVYGDANSRNIAFAQYGLPTVFLLDCDGVRREGDQTMSHRFQARWSDPYTAGVNSIRSDRYLLALWILRTLSSSMVQPTPGEVLDWSKLPVPLSTHLGLQQLLSDGLGPPDRRPEPANFLPILDRLHAVA